jgi:hypothetical protein
VERMRLKVSFLETADPIFCMILCGEGNGWI